MDAPSLYQKLADDERLEETLPLIESLVRQAPHIATSWFNYGWCLKELGRDGEAVDAFLRCFLIGGQSDSEAFHLAGELIRTANPDDGIPATPEESFALAAELLRQRLEQNPPVNPETVQ
jgi:tetratricopeptide (TPR) repeat protein